MANSVVINYLVKVGGVKDVDALKAKLTGLTTSKGFQSAVTGVGISAGMVAWNALGNAVKGVGDALMDAALAAAADETSQNRLYTAVAANTQGWDGNREAIEAVIAERMKLAFTDEEQRDSLALLVAYTNDVTEALDIQRAAMDLARLKNISLAESSSAIVKGMEGSGRALKELGINVAELTNKQEVLTKVQEKAAGQAEAYAESAEGSFASLQIVTDELAESIGYALLPYLKELAKTLRDDVLPSVGLAGDAIGVLGEAIGLLTTPQRVVIEGAVDLGTAFRALGGDAQAAGDIMRGLPVIGDEVRRQQKQAADASKAWSARLTGLAGSLEDVGGAAGDTAGDLGDLGGEVHDVRKEFNKLEDSVDDALDALIEASLGPKQLKVELAIAKDELGENQRALDKLKGTKNLTADQRDEIRELKSKVLDGKEEVIRLTARLTTMGKVSLAGLRAEMNRLDVGMGNAADEARELLAVIKSIQSRTSGGNTWDTPGGGGEKHGATGGFARPGETWEVGEDGRETLHVTSAGTLIVPNANSAPGTTAAVAPIYLAVSLDGQQIAATIERRQYFAASVAPASIR